MGRPRFLIVLLLVLVPRLAAAQPEEDPRKTAPIHIGPFYITPSLALTNFGIDTNVFNAQGEQKRDFTFTLTPRADVWLPVARRAMVKTSAAVDLVWFQTFDSERSIGPSVSVRPEIYFNRLTLFAEGSYLKTRQRPSFEIDVRSERVEKAAQVGFDIRVFRKLSVELAGRETQTRFAGDAYYLGTSLRETLDRNERAAAMTLRHRWTPLTTFVVRAEAISDRFIRSPERNSDSVRVMPGVEFKPRAVISGSGYLGYRRFQSLDDAVPDFDGVVASASLSYTLLGATKFSFTADRDVQYSFEPAQPYFVVDGYGLGVSRSLGARYDVTVGLGRFQYSYRAFTGAGLARPEPGRGARPESGRGASPERVDVTRNLSASFGYRPNRETRIGLGAAYWERSSNTANYRDYNGLRIGVSVEYGF